MHRWVAYIKRHQQLEIVDELPRDLENRRGADARIVGICFLEYYKDFEVLRYVFVIMNLVPVACYDQLATFTVNTNEMVPQKQNSS